MRVYTVTSQLFRILYGKVLEKTKQIKIYMWNQLVRSVLKLAGRSVL